MPFKEKLDLRRRNSHHSLVNYEEILIVTELQAVWTSGWESELVFTVHSRSSEIKASHAGPAPAGSENWTGALPGDAQQVLSVPSAARLGDGVNVLNA